MLNIETESFTFKRKSREKFHKTAIGMDNKTSDDCFMTFPKGRVSSVNGILLLTVYSVVMLFIIVCNAVLVVGLYKTKQTQDRPHKMFLTVGVFDLVIGAILLPLHVSLINQTSRCVTLALQSFISEFCSVFAAMLVFEIGLDRYFMVVKSDFYRSMSEKPIFRIYVVTDICISFALASFSASSIRRKSPMLIGYFHLTSALLIMVLIFATLCTNIGIYRYVHRTAKEMRRYSATSRYTHYDGRTTRTITVIMFVLVVTYSPAVLGFIYSAIQFLCYKNDVDTSSAMFKVITWMTVPMFFNSGLNSLIFTYRNEKIYKYLKSVLCCQQKIDVRNSGNI